MTQNHHHTAEPPVGEPAASQNTGIGELLRGERERRGLSHSQISRRTRLRKTFIEALENEDWDRLPQPVFVKGFLRSYASVLGIDPERLLGLYSVEIDPNIFPPTPPQESGDPLTGKAKSIMIALGLILTAVTGYALYKHAGTDIGSMIHPQGTVSPQPSSIGLHTSSDNLQPRPSTVPQNHGFTQANLPAGRVTREALPSAHLGRTMNGISDPSMNTGAVGSPHAEPTPTAETDPPSVSSPLTLRASVVEKTWVRIRVDDQAPEEYIFSAGSRPSWEAQHHFHLVVGNAGGMKLELNGEKMGKLGASGEVLRLRLP
jgi:cytoskeleton protein RodZ